MSKKRNALKQRAHAFEVMLWSEKYEDYEALRAGVYQEYPPAGSSEEYEVGTLVDLLWRRRRLDLLERFNLQKRLDQVREGNERGRHVQNLRALASDFGQADSVEKVETLLGLMCPMYRNTVLRDTPRKEEEDPSTWGPKIAKALLAWVQPARHLEAEEFIATFDLAAFDASLARIERLDAMIDRTIKRLMQIKTMKQMYGRLEPKLISVIESKDTQARDSSAKLSME
jgi:hypothetical protein